VGNLYISDTGNNRVRKITPQGVIVTAAGNGTAGFSGDGGPATAAELDLTVPGLQPSGGVAVDASGNLFITDSGNNRIRMVTAQGIITTVAGSGYSGFSGDGGPATSADLNWPVGLAVDTSGDFFFADNCRIREVTPQGIITTVAGTGCDTGGFSGDGGPATSAGLALPVGVAVDARGDLFIADLNGGRIRKVTPQGIITAAAGSGNSGPLGDGGPAASAYLSLPMGVAVDNLGNLFIDDVGNLRTRMVTPQGTITTVAGGASGTVASFTGDGGPAASIALGTNDPMGIATDTEGNVFIGDGYNRIRKLAPTPTSTAGCIYSLDQTSASFGIGGGSNIVGVLASGSTCPWLAVSWDTWLAVDSPAGLETGLGLVPYAVSANQSSVARNGTIWAGGNSLAVSQTSAAGTNIVEQPAEAINFAGLRRHTATVSNAQAIVNEALGFAPPYDDLNGDGFVNVVDVGIAIDEALLTVLNVSTTSLTVGSSSCNDFQNITLTSSSGTAPFTVGINYGGNNSYGQWLYASIPGSGSTDNATTFSALANTTAVNLTIGLNLEIGTATPTATVVVTPSGGSPIDITVYYYENVSCGGNTGSANNGFVTVTPGNISLSAETAGTSSQSVTIQNVTGSATAYGFSVSPTSSWLTATANSNVISPGGSASLIVIGTASKTSGVGTYNGMLTITPQLGGALQIPITFTVGGGTLNTLLVGGTGTNTYTTSLTDVAGNTSSVCVPLQDSNAGSNSYYLSQASSTGNWLLANNQITVNTVQGLAPGDNACVTLSLSNAASSLASGAYQGSVAITSSSGSTATINVNLYVSSGAAPGITVQQGEIYVFPQVAPSSSVVQDEVFNVTAQSGYNLGTPSLTSSANGVFSMSTPVVSNNTVTFTVTSNSSGLATGVYASTVTIPSSYGSDSSNTTTITIVLPVGAGGTTIGTGGGTTTVAPTQLAFQQQLGSTFWTSGKEAQSITITGAQGSAWSASIVYPAGSPSNWLNFDSPSSGSGTFGNAPATLLVDLFNGVTSLATSSSLYQATVNITTSNGTYSVPVTLLVTATNSPVLLGNPASATFNVSSAAPSASQTISIVGSDNTGSTSSPPISVGTPTASWLTAAASGNQLTLAVNAASQSTGVYSATIPVQASAYAAPIQYPVVLVVNGGSGGPLTLNSTAISFTNVTAAVSTTLNVTASTSTNFTVVSSETNCTNANWLTTNNGSYTATSTATAINVEVDPNGIANGTTCSGVVSLMTPSATQTVNVSMTVGGSGAEARQ
jgi:sugar lactone lactonase YvrE